jgi:hypothetical protein
MSQMRRLEDYFEAKRKEVDKLCTRCGACCGAYDGDPCLHLKKGEKGAFFCEIYPQRLGTRRTVKGEEFDCVLIEEILKTSWEGDWRCAYKKSRPF